MRDGDLFIMQIAESLDAQGITPEALARAMSIPVERVLGWLNRTEDPSIGDLERVFRVLRRIPVFVPITSGYGGLRDYLDEHETEVWDLLPDSPVEVLKSVLKDLQLQRNRVEQERSVGLINDAAYRKIILELAFGVKHISEAMSKVTDQRVGAKDSAVEIVFGSNRGPGYDTEKVARVQAKDALRLEEHPVEVEDLSKQQTAEEVQVENSSGKREE